MQSTELSSLAGVTVRTLRHYHQIGILDEPPRGTNGYRRYGVHDLIRVLRIRRLAALGVPLEQTPRFLDADVSDASDRAADGQAPEEPGTEERGAADQGAAALLDRLDQELAAQGARITAQREVIAQLRRDSAAPDVPPELARFLVTMARAAPSPDMARMDRDQTVLLAHLAGETGLPHLVDFYQRLSGPELLPRVTAIAARFAALGPDTDAGDLDRFVEDFVAAIAPVLATLADPGPDVHLTSTADLLAEYTTTTLDETQQRALELIGERLAAAG